MEIMLHPCPPADREVKDLLQVSQSFPSRLPGRDLIHIEDSTRNSHLKALRASPISISRPKGVSFKPARLLGKH